MLQTLHLLSCAMSVALAASDCNTGGASAGKKLCKLKGPMKFELIKYVPDHVIDCAEYCDKMRYCKLNKAMEDGFTAEASAGSCTCKVNSEDAKVHKWAVAGLLESACTKARCWELYKDMYSNQQKGMNTPLDDSASWTTQCAGRTDEVERVIIDPWVLWSHEKHMEERIENEELAGKDEEHAYNSDSSDPLAIFGEQEITSSCATVDMVKEILTKCSVAKEELLQVAGANWFLLDRLQVECQKVTKDDIRGVCSEGCTAVLKQFGGLKPCSPEDLDCKSDMMMLSVLFACNAHCRASKRDELETKMAIEALKKAEENCGRDHCDELLEFECEEYLNLAVNKQGALPEEHMEKLQGLVNAKVKCERERFVQGLRKEIEKVLGSCKVSAEELDFHRPGQLMKRLECQVRDGLTDKLCEEPCRQSIFDMDVRAKGEVICVSEECKRYTTVAAFLLVVRNFCLRLHESENGYQKGEAHWQNLCKAQEEKEAQAQNEKNILDMVMKLLDNVVVQHCKLSREMLSQLSDGEMPADLQAEVCREDSCDKGISILKDFWNNSPEEIKNALNSGKFSNINKGVNHLLNLEPCTHRKKKTTHFQRLFNALP